MQRNPADAFDSKAAPPARTRIDPVAVQQALVDLIERNRPAAVAACAVTEVLRACDGRVAAPLAVLTRDQVRALIQAFLVGDVDTAEVRSWATAIADRLGPFGLPRPITPEAGYHYAIYAVVSNLANDRDAFLPLDVDGIGRMSCLLDCQDPTGVPSEEAYRSRLARLLDLGTPEWINLEDQP